MTEQKITPKIYNITRKAVDDKRKYFLSFRLTFFYSEQYFDKKSYPKWVDNRYSEAKSSLKK